VAPQITHSAMEFANEFPEEQKDWHIKSNSIICLAVPNEKHLWELSEKLTKKGLKHSKFYEPDCGEELTAIAVVPTDNTRKALSNYPLVGRKPTPEGAQELLNKKFDIVDGMRACFQHGQQNMLDHGNAVKDHLFDLINHLRHDAPLKNEWRLPEWLYQHKEQLLENIHDDFTLWKYTVWHDCSKPFVKKINVDGTIHYPNHSIESAKIWRSISDNLIVEKLIYHDMVMHTYNVESIIKFCKENEKNTTCTLLLAALSELHSNAIMFGGINSDSFKIKYKRLDRLGKNVCQTYFMDFA